MSVRCRLVACKLQCKVVLDNVLAISLFILLFALKSLDEYALDKLIELLIWLLNRHLSIFELSSSLFVVLDVAAFESISRIAGSRGDEYFVIGGLNPGGGGIMMDARRLSFLFWALLLICKYEAVEKTDSVAVVKADDTEGI